MIPANRMRVVKKRVVGGGSTVVPMGIIHTADQLMTNGAWTKIVNNSVNTTEFPLTNLNNNNIVISGGGEALVRVRGRFQQGNTANMRVVVYINGTLVGTSWLSGTTSTATVQFGGDETFFFSNGDLLSYYGWATSGTSNRRTMYGTTDKTGTYLEVVPV